MDRVRKPGIIEAVVRRRMPHLSDDEITQIMESPQGEILTAPDPMFRKVRDIVEGFDPDIDRLAAVDENFNPTEIPDIKDEISEPDNTEVWGIHHVFSPTLFPPKHDNDSPEP